MIRLFSDEDLIEPYLNKDFPLLYEDETVEQALTKFRALQASPQKIIYFYVVDRSKQLLGTVPTRLLLTAQLSTPLKNIMLTRTVNLNANDTMGRARQLFAENKFLALPVLDGKNLIGVLEIERFVSDIAEFRGPSGFNDIHELMGLEALAKKPPFRVFLARMTWLSTTLLAGLVAAFITNHFETTVAKTILLTFFLTLILGLNESVACNRQL